MISSSQTICPPALLQEVFAYYVPFIMQLFMFSYMQISYTYPAPSGVILLNSLI